MTCLLLLLLLLPLSDLTNEKLFPSCINVIKFSMLQSYKILKDPCLKMTS